MPVRAVLAALADLVLPTGCAGCGTTGSELCPACRRPLLGPAAASMPEPCPPGMPPTYAVAPYDGAVRAALLGLKEHGRTGLTAPLAGGLAASVRAAAPDGASIALVPVPSTAAARRARGDDPLLRLARAAADRLDGPDVPVRVVRGLRHARRTVDQAGLGSLARAANLSGALALRRPALPVLDRLDLVVLVDDIVTTGATLAEAARALGVAGVPVHAAAVVAGTRRWVPSSAGSPAGSQVAG